MSIEIKKVYSDNPYVDELVYYTMQLGLSTVLKLKQRADDCETLDIIKNADIYTSCIDKDASLKMFDYFPYEVLTSTKDKNGKSYGAGLPDNIARRIADNPKYVFDLDKEAQNHVLKSMMIWYPEHYEEGNNYYRMLNGLPPVGYPDIYVEDWRLGDVKFDTSIPLHKMSDGDITTLDKMGILDDLYDIDKDNREFIKHLGKKKIDIYLARKSRAFDILYVPPIDSESIREMYIDRLQNNITYTLRAVYSEAYKYDSDYYDNIIAIFIVIITLTDIISRVQEFITRKEIFDIRSCEYIFQSYGVKFFPEIPLRYQIAMVKNIHTLLKYKSTAKCMVDICSLFGFDNVKVFKYYLMKDRNIDSSTGEYSFTGDNDKDFTLKFVKLPLEDDKDDYVRMGSNHMDYDEITDGDPTWDGGLDHDKVKNDILKEEFNIIRTKYISIDTVYDIAKISMQLSYFFNMIYDNYEKEDLLKVRIPFIDGSHQFDFADTFSFLSALSYYYYNMKDVLMDEQDKVLYVNGFNFRADLAEIASSLSDSKYYEEVMKHLKAFDIPVSQIPSYEQMMQIFVNNLNIRDILVEGMRNSDNKRQYDAYKKLYDSLMIVELTMDHFKNPETGELARDNDIDEDHPNGYATYTEYFRWKEPSLYYELMDILSIEDPGDRKQRISTMIDNVVMALENYINLDEFDALLHGLPAVSAEAIKQYIAQVINFYKSFKVDFLGLNTIYYLDDKLDGIIHIIDDVFLHRNFTKNEMVYITELISKMKVTIEPNDKINILESIFLDIYTWAYKQYNEKIYIRDSIPTKIVRLMLYSVVMIAERYGIHCSLDLRENLDIRELIDSIKISMNKSETIGLKERMWIIPVEDPPVGG